MYKLTEIYQEIKVINLNQNVFLLIQKFIEKSIKENEGKEFRVKLKKQIGDSAKLNFEFGNNKNSSYDYTCYLEIYDLKNTKSINDEKYNYIDMEEGGNKEEILKEIKDWLIKMSELLKDEKLYYKLM